ncbi:MAG: SprT-like domain-containing protein [Elusimicrobia bacterium]|nr:SprT-like domain-containing protein [Elusimicrobiota bacterium]
MRYRNNAPRHTLLALALLAAIAYAALHRPAHDPEGRGGGQPAEAPSPDHALFAENLRKPVEAALQDRYRDIDARHFAGALPDIPVHWEERLSERGKDLPSGMGLEGLWLMEDGKALILVNPRLREDEAALTRTLCHEMAHEYLFTRGDSRSSHGPPFQAVLRRLWDEKAFTGLFATDEERAELRAWLDQRKADLAQSEEAVGLARRAVDEAEGEFSALNSRIQTANERGEGWPSQEEMDRTTARRDLRVTQYNGLIESRNGAIGEFNLKAERYNLILAYPDGRDEERVAAMKDAPEPGP